MADVTSQRTIGISFEGGVNAPGLSYAAQQNITSPAAIEFVTLTMGDNAVTPPDGATGCTIIPPSDNEEIIILKGVNGDTGIKISPINWTSIGLDASEDGFVLNVTDDIEGVRLIWS